jgi:Immunoglobulin domain
MISPTTLNKYAASGLYKLGCVLVVGFMLFAFKASAGTPPVISVQPTNQIITAGSNVTFSVTASSATTMTYQWYFNGVKITSATNYTYTLTKAQFANAGSYYVAAINAFGSINSSSARLNINPPTGSALSSPWVTADIGTTGLNGSAYNVTGLYTVNGAGTNFSGSTADQFRYVYQTMVGDGSIIAKINSQSGTNANALTGIIIRETTQTGSSFMAAARRGDGNMVVRSRTSTGAATTTVTNSATFTLPNYWLELVRSGNNISALTSTNGTAWVAFKTNTITMATNITFGLFVTSGNTNILDSDTFTNITAVP